MVIRKSSQSRQLRLLDIYHIANRISFVTAYIRERFKNRVVQEILFASIFDSFEVSRRAFQSD